MAHRQDDIDMAALDWAVRTGDPAFDDWEGLQAWLESDPAHAPRYQAMMADVDDMAAIVPPSVPVPVAAPYRWRRWAGGAVAASVALVAGFAAIEMRPQPYALETRAGETRTVHLADGSVVAMGGGTRLLLDRRAVRHVGLDRGEAMFTVHHDDSDPFEVAVGGERLVDVGTAFDVARDAAETRVAVSEGAVDFNPGPGVVRLVAGQGLVSTAGHVRVTRVEPADVGAWRAGRLVYDGVPLETVAADLSRTLGMTIAVEPAIAQRPIRATLSTGGLARDPALLGPLLDVAMRRSGDRWVLSPLP